MSSTPQLIIEAGLADRHYWRDLWYFRQLFWVLAQRDVAVRYKQTVLGLAWAVIQPVLTMSVFTVVFGYIAKLPVQGDVPYALMVFSALLPWQFFSSSLTSSSNSVIGNVNLVSKVYFPRMIIPSSTAVVTLIDFMISFAVLILMMFWFRFLPGWQILTLPLFIIMAFLASVGPGLWFAALNVKYRDFRAIIPFVVQLGLYISPVGFSTDIIPSEWKLIYHLNPMVSVIDGFRWALLGGESELYFPGLLTGLTVILLLLWIGIKRFRIMEKTFADLI